MSSEKQEMNIQTIVSGSEEASVTSAPTSIGKYDAAEKIAKIQKDIKNVNFILFGVVIVVVITFIIAFTATIIDKIKDEGLYLKYDELHQSYYNEISKLKDEINNQKIECNNLKNQIDLLKEKKPKSK